jgi:hypothetical protein
MFWAYGVILKHLEVDKIKIHDSGDQVLGETNGDQQNTTKKLYFY